MKLFNFLENISEMVFPSNFKCLGCDRDILNGMDFCDKCEKNLPYNNKNICEVCGAKIDGVGKCVICGSKKSYEIARAPFLYEGIIKKLIYDFKYNNAKYLFKPLSKYMINCYLQNNMRADLIVPIPLYFKRFKQRGYNQSELLGVEIGKALNIPVLNALSRIKDTSTQTNLNFEERKENIKRAFKLVDKSVKGKNILLIDDVYTSGATIKEACSVLNSASVNKIYVLTLAHTDFNK